MFSERRRDRATVHAMPADAWFAWRQAATRVQAAWEEVSRARRETRAAAYAEYGQALRLEEDAARELGAQLASATLFGAELPAIAA